MNKTSLKFVALAATLAITGACAKKAPEQLPPPPVSAEAPPEPVTEAPVGQTVVPGSRADFMQNVTGDRVFFELDSHTLDDRARAVLDSQAVWLQRNPNVSVTIEGHADERGTREYNLALGDRRANAAKNYLAAKGIAASRMTTVSWGKERPEALGSDEAAWAQNRRAVTVVPQ